MRRAILAAALVLGATFPAAAHGADPSPSAAVEPPLPADVDPVSRYRLPLPTRADMTTDVDRRAFDEMTRARRPVLWLYSPRLAEAMEAAHAYVRSGTGLDARQVEIAILVTARALNSQVMWTTWESQSGPGHSAFLDPAVIDLIKYCRPAVGLGPKETLIIRLGRELMGPTRKLSSPTFAEAIRLFGRKGTVDLVDLMALYQVTAVELTAYDAHLHVGETPLLPPLSATPGCRAS